MHNVAEGVRDFCVGRFWVQALRTKQLPLTHKIYFESVGCKIRLYDRNNSLGLGCRLWVQALRTKQPPRPSHTILYILVSCSPKRECETIRVTRSSAPSGNAWLLWQTRWNVNDILYFVCTDPHYDERVSFHILCCIGEVSRMRPFCKFGFIFSDPKFRALRAHTSHVWASGVLLYSVFVFRNHKDLSAKRVRTAALLTLVSPPCKKSQGPSRRCRNAPLSRSTVWVLSL